MATQDACSCVVGYNYINIIGLKFFLYWYSLRGRLPKVTDMLLAFIMNIVDSPEFLISDYGSIVVTGYCLGGHIAAALGERVNALNKGQLLAIWGNFCSMHSNALMLAIL